MYQVTSAAEREHGAKVFVLRDPGDVNVPSFRVVREITGEVLFYWGEPSRTYTGELRDLLYLAVLLHEVPDARFEIDPDPSDPKPYAIHYAPGAIHYIREHSALEHLRLRTGHRADDDGNDRPSLSRREKIALGAAGLLAIAIIVGAIVNSAISGRSASSAGQVANAGSVEPVCYISVYETLSQNTITVAVLGASDCTPYTLGNSEFIPTANTQKGPGNAVCAGFINGKAATVISPSDAPHIEVADMYCNELGFSYIGS